MGTTARVTVWAPDASVCETAIDSVFAVFHRVDREMSTYRPESGLSLLNRDGAEQAVVLPTSILDVLTASFRFHEMSNGAFDPTVLPLMVLWGFRGGEPRLPDATQLEAVLRCVGLSQVVVDRARGTASFGRDGVSLDLGGIAKGYALDVARRVAKEAGADAGQFDLGGNLLVFGAAARGEVGIQDPRHRDRLAGRVVLDDVSVATSGGYERYVTIEGRNYSHIIDPRTGYPVDRVASATIVSYDAMAADALSTACAVMGRAACLDLVDRLEGVEGVVVWYEADTMRMASSKGIEVLDP